MSDLSLPILTTVAVRVNFLKCRSVLSLSNTFHPIIFGRKSTTLPLGLGPCGSLSVPLPAPLHAAIRRLARWSLPLGSLSQRTPLTFYLPTLLRLQILPIPLGSTGAWDGPTLYLLCCSPPGSQLGSLPQPWTCFPQTPHCSLLTAGALGPSLAQHSFCLAGGSQ